MKRIFLFCAGLLWLGFALGFGFFLVQYIAGGAGLQFFIPVISETSVLVGLVHFIGLATAALICFAISAGLCARAFCGEDQESKAKHF
jgi:hypothetical protein